MNGSFDGKKRYLLAQPTTECTLPGALIPSIDAINSHHGPAIGGTVIAVSFSPLSFLLLFIVFCFILFPNRIIYHI